MEIFCVEYIPKMPKYILEFLSVIILICIAEAKEPNKKKEFYMEYVDESNCSS